MSRLQSLSKTATVAELREANKVVDLAKQSSDKGLYSASSALGWSTAVLVTSSDASYVHVSTEVAGSEEREPVHSQQGAFNFLVSPDGLISTP